MSITKDRTTDKSNGPPPVATSNYPDAIALFDVDAWMSDPPVCRLSLAARAVWIDLVFTMHQVGPNAVTHGIRSEIGILARLVRCSVDQLRAAFAEFEANHFAEIIYHGSCVDVVALRAFIRATPLASR